MLNNNGYTLIEVLAVIVLISFASFVIIRGINSTLSVSEKEAYKIMKDNIVSAGYDYVNECDNDIINTEFSFDGNNTFTASVLEKYGYFSNLKSPIDGKYVGECLVLDAIKENGVIIVDIKDNCY